MLLVAFACVVALELTWRKIPLLGIIGRLLNIKPLLGIICRLIGWLVRRFFLWIDSIPGKIRRWTSIEEREKYAGYATRIFQVMFTCYCVSRMLILLTVDLLDRIRITALKSYNKLNQFWHFEFEGSCKRWSRKLPDDIMHSLLQQLCAVDYIRCRAVCRSWQASVDVGILDQLCCPAPQLPWLMFSAHPLSTTYNFFLRLSDLKVRKLNPATYHMDRIDCVGSIEGWLIVVDSALWRPEAFLFSNKVNFFFLNPMSNDRVMLPSSESALPCKCSSREPCFLISKVVASSVPTNQHCLVASCCSAGHLAFCRQSDQSWTLIDSGGIFFHDIELLDGKIYAVTWKASTLVRVIHIEDATAGGRPSYTIQTLVMLEPHWPVIYRISPRTWGEVGVLVGQRDIISLAKDSKSGDLFMVFRMIHYSFEEDPIVPWDRIVGKHFYNPPQTRGFRVFKLERSVEGGFLWVEVLDLGDRILFVSESCNKFVHGDGGNCLQQHNDEAFEKNCIYFAFDNPSSGSPYKGYDVGVFSLRTKSIKHFQFKFPKKHPRTALWTRSVWFTPNPW